MYKTLTIKAKPLHITLFLILIALILIGAGVQGVEDTFNAMFYGYGMFFGFSLALSFYATIFTIIARFLKWIWEL